MLPDPDATPRSPYACDGQEGTFRTIFEHSGSAMALLGDEDGTVALCNWEFERLTGWPRADVQGRMRWSEFLVDAEALARIAALREAGPGGPERAPETFEFRFRTRDGALRDMEAIATRMPGSRSTLLVLADITERKGMQLACAASEARYRDLFHGVPVGLYQTSADGRMLNANRVVLEMLGLEDLENLDGWNAVEVYLDPKEREAWRQELEARGDLHREVQWRRRDGSVFWVDERARIRKDAQGGLLYDGSAVDITERKQAEEAGEILRERLRSSEKFEAIGHLAGGVAHDFNNQLTAILGFAETLEEISVGELQKQFAENIVRSCQRSADLTRKLLAFARKGSVLSEPVDLHQIILEVVSLLKHSLDKRIILQTRLEADRPVVMGDPTQLQNALMNMAINARDAMPEGGTLSFTTQVVALDPAYCRKMPYEIVPGTYLEACVADTGMGMEPETIRHIFEPFFTTKELGKGTGLGLASVYGTVKQHQGYIEARSTPGEGSCFQVYLPFCDLSVPVPDPVVAPRGNGHILFVDDEAIVAEVTRELLDTLHYQVTLCRDGLEATEVYARIWPTVDLVILDMVMPRMGGKDAFFALRAINPQVKVLLVSGYSIEGEAQMLLRGGALGFLQKPFRRAELAQAVAKAMTS